MPRVLFGALAVVDAALLAYLMLQCGWLDFDVKPTVPTNVLSTLEFIVNVALWVLALGEKAFFALFFFVVGAGIVRELTDRRDFSRWRAVSASIVLLIPLVGIASAWLAILQPIVAAPNGAMIDRLIFFDALAEKSRQIFGGMLGTRGSTGALLVFLLIAAYLAEKYLLAWWRVRWLLPVLPLIATGWIGWSVHDGEQRQRDFVAAQQWRPVSDQQTWIDAVGACERLGSGWRLPRRSELALYLATRPPEIQGWTGAAWTPAAAGSGTEAIAVELKPRVSGRWSREGGDREISLCEEHSNPAYANDWVTALRPSVCAHTEQSPMLYTAGIKTLVRLRGNVQVVQAVGATICVQPGAADSSIGIPKRRIFPREQEFTRVAEFSAYTAQYCSAPQVMLRAVCFALAPDLPDFEEDGDESTMGAFCALANDAKGCFQYALLMDRHPANAPRAECYRDLACTRGYKPACAKQ
jgi:hypothetical protein